MTNITETRPLLLSKTIAGIVAMAIGFAVNKFGYIITPEDTKIIVDVVGGLVFAFGTFWAVKGRLNKKIKPIK